MDQQRKTLDYQILLACKQDPQRHGSNLGGAIHGSTLPMISDGGK